MKSPLPDAPAPQSLLEAAVYVDDLDAAREFYRDILGLKLFQEVPGRHMFFALGPSVLLVFNPTATSQPPGNPKMPVPPHGARGPGHVCFAMKRDEIAAMETRLQAAEALQEAGWQDVYAHVMKGTGHGIAPDGLSVALAFMRDKLGL